MRCVSVCKCTYDLTFDFSNFCLAVYNTYCELDDIESMMAMIGSSRVMFIHLFIVTSRCYLLATQSQ